MTEEDKEWKDYLLSIGVIDLNDEDEINERLDEVERNNPKFQAELEEALREVFESKLENIGKRDTRAWLQSLLEEEDE